jgi:Rrf2 family iron-sulfur cluster assembly transcriptional regulator
MKLTTKGRYAVTAVLDLALHEGQHPVSLVDIAKRQDISLSYLEQLFSRLRKQGIVLSVRGPGGGYHLGRDAMAISVAEIILAVDETVDNTQCQGNQDCRHHGPCLTHDLWAELNQRIYDYLHQISLKDLITGQHHICHYQTQKIKQQPTKTNKTHYQHC